MHIQHRRGMEWESAYTGENFSLLLKYSSVSSPLMYFSILFRVKSKVLSWLTYYCIIWLLFTSWIFLTISHLVYNYLATPIFTDLPVVLQTFQAFSHPKDLEGHLLKSHIYWHSPLQAFSEMLASQDAIPTDF